MKVALALVLALGVAVPTGTAFAQKKVDADALMDDSPEGIAAEDTAVTRRARAQVTATKAKAAAFRNGNSAVITSCEAMFRSQAEGNKVCSTASGSIVVLPGAVVNGSIINAPNTSETKR